MANWKSSALGPLWVLESRKDLKIPDEVKRQDLSELNLERICDGGDGH